MRLIDADALIGDLHNHAFLEGDDREIVYSVIQKQPTIEQPEQKHGHWKGFTQSRYFGMDDDGEPIFRDGLFYVCSKCRRKSIIKHPYCPRCGAKMDDEVKQE